MRLLQAEDAVVRPLGGGRMVDLRPRDFVTLPGSLAERVPRAEPGLPSKKVSQQARRPSSAIDRCYRIPEQAQQCRKSRCPAA